MSDSLALKNLMVLDLSRILAGPWASQILADLGATVIKVERPGAGDDTRGFGPPFFSTGRGDDGDLSAYFMSANRGKQSIAINMATPEGVALIKQLAAKADVVIENFKQGDLAKRGLDYAALKQGNPRLIYCSVTGFGQTGPYKHRPGYDFMIQGMAGLMSITGEPDGQPGAGPQRVGVAVADIMTGLYSTIAILGALNERHQSGLGQHIDMALLDVVTAVLANQAANYLVSGQVPQRMGNTHPNIVPYQTFGTQDGYIIVAVANDSQFIQLCHCLDVTDLAKHELYATNALRVKHRDKLIPLLQAVFDTRTSSEWMPVLEAHNVPYGPINNIGQVLDNEQVKSRGMQMELDGMPLVANPIRYSRSKMNYTLPPPRLGQHSREVLSTVLSLTQAEIAQLVDQGIVG